MQTKSGRLAAAVLVWLSGCGIVTPNYASVDRTPEGAVLVGRRCVATRDCILPEARWHYLPTLDRTATPPRSSLVAIPGGTVLRVVHLESFQNFEWGETRAYAVAETGPQRGRNVIVGTVSDGVVFGDPAAGLSVEVGTGLRPATPADAAHFRSVARGDGTSDVVVDALPSEFPGSPPHPLARSHSGVKSDP